MVVEGLYSLLEDNSQIFKDIRFRDSKLLIDGCNLVYALYFKSKLERNHGGQYLAFQTYVQSFFTTLKKCGIKPYVVVDGGASISKIKQKTKMERGSVLVQKTHSAAQTGKTEKILPVLTKLVFQQTLIDMEVPLVKCIGEINRELAALASEWGCPVLSNTTNFYIFDLPGGFLRHDDFRWESADSYIPCKRYTTSHFCSFFNINNQLLPAFATLAGNDYVNLKEIKWVKFLPGGKKRKTYRIASLEGLLIWLRRFQTTKDALRAAMTLMPNVSRQEQTMVEKAMLEYRLPSSSLQGFFTEGAALSLPKEVTCVPDWVCASLAKGDLSGDVLDMLLLGRRNLHKPVESGQLPSSNLVSQPIRQVLYGLLPALGRSGVLEVDRVGLDLHTVTVKPVVQGATQGLRLDSLPQADRTVRLKVCVETLGVNQETLEGVPPHLRLPVAVTCYWLRRAKPDLKLLKALLMVMIQGELNRQKGLTTACVCVGWQGETNQISQPPDCVVAHSFNQWQACLINGCELNQLLCMPLPKPHFAWLFQGRLVHQRVKQLQEKEPEEILPSDDFISLYRSILEAVLQSDPGADRAGGTVAQLTANMGHLAMGGSEQ